MMDWSKFIGFLDENGACSGPAEWVKGQPSAQAAFAACPDGNWLIWLVIHLSDGPVRQDAVRGLATMIDVPKTREMGIVHKAARAVVFGAGLRSQDHMSSFRKAIGSPAGRMLALTHPDQMSALAMVRMAQVTPSSGPGASSVLVQTAFALVLQSRAHSGMPSDAAAGADIVRASLSDWTEKHFPAHAARLGPR